MCSSEPVHVRPSRRVVLVLSERSDGRGKENQADLEIPAEKQQVHLGSFLVFGLLDSRVDVVQTSVRASLYGDLINWGLVGSALVLRGEDTQEAYMHDGRSMRLAGNIEWLYGRTTKRVVSEHLLGFRGALAPETDLWVA